MFTLFIGFIIECLQLIVSVLQNTMIGDLTYESVLIAICLVSLIMRLFWI